MTNYWGEGGRKELNHCKYGTTQIIHYILVFLLWAQANYCKYWNIASGTRRCQPALLRKSSIVPTLVILYTLLCSDYLNFATCSVLKLWIFTLQNKQGSFLYCFMMAKLVCPVTTSLFCQHMLSLLLFLNRAKDTRQDIWAGRWWCFLKKTNSKIHYFCSNLCRKTCTSFKN